MQTLTEEILSKFDEVDAKYELIKLPDGISDDVAEHMAFHKGEMDQANINLVYKVNGDFVVVQKRGDTKIDNKKLRKALGTDSVRFATVEEMAKLELEPGLVPVTGHGLQVYTDQKLLETEELYSTASDHIHALKFETNDLKKVNPEMTIVDVTGGSEITRVRRVLTGITPSGNSLHIGNYFGAVKHHIDLQNTLDEAYYFVADLHALTTVQNRKALEDNITNVVLDYLALGLDPEKCVFFRQADVAVHSQLMVVLGNYVSYGQMQRMHAFKDKLAKGTDIGSINMGLFNYPILMAADILAYKPDGIPVGEDQRQHVELARDIAENFNRTYDSELFPLPEPLINKGLAGKVVGTDGKRKMSKSLGNIIGIFENEEIIKKQIMSSYTDPNRLKATDPGKVEGNPVFIYHNLLNEDKDEVADLESRYRAGKVGDVEVKQSLLAAHQRVFADARKKRKELESDLKVVEEILEKGAVKARKLAEKTMDEVYEMIGEKPFA